MRRLAIFISLVLLCCGCASVQPQLEGGSAVEMTRVPDKVFRAYLIEQGYVEPCRWPLKSFGLRMWHRDVVRRTPMGRALQLLNVHNMGIESLQGVELFDSLKVLICSENPLQRVDLSHCPRLKQFSAIETPLQELDLSHCAELKLIELSHNKLRHLDVSHNPKLEEIFCVFSPGITSLDISANPNLRTLYLRQTSVQIVDIRHNPSFRKLCALDTPLEYIVVSPHNSLDSITAMVEDGVEVCTLPPNAPLPEVHLIGKSDTIAVRTISHKAHEQKVMTHTQARAAGIDETHLREVVYKPAFTFDTLTKKYEDWGLVHSDKELAQFILTWQVFLQGMADEMAERHFDVDKPYKGHCVVFFSEDGYVDYFLYNFLGDERPSSEQQQRFEQIVRSYIANNPIGYYGSRPFSQCGGFVIQPNHSNTEGE